MNSGLRAVVFLFYLLFASSDSRDYSPLRDRISVIRGKQYDAFIINATSTLLTRATSMDGHSWSWFPLYSVIVPLSNPSAVYAANSSRPIQVAFLTNIKTFTEPYLLYGNDSGTLHTEIISTHSIPSGLPVEQWSPDSVVLKLLNNYTFVFVRSQAAQSHIYWASRPENGLWSSWGIIGDKSHNVKSDPAVAINTFLNRFEVFVLLDEGVLFHAWQSGMDSFSDWYKIGTFTPTFNSVPAVHEMTHGALNGMLQVFVRGTDKFVHHISQTTCDKLNDPWGPCTWEIFFSKLGDREIPGSIDAPNPISVGVTIHGGLEVFVLDDDANLWSIFQLERGGSWRSWNKLGPLDSKNAYATIPSIYYDDSGWWNTLSVGSADKMLHTYTQPRSVSVDKSITYAANLTVKWSVPDDVASRTDWLGIFPVNTTGDGYVDFRYVGGGQNPSGDPVNSGTILFSLFLPDDTYEVRYLTKTDKPLLVETNFHTSNRTYEPEWIQLYKGIALGLGDMSTDYINCVEDGNRTIKSFEDSFKAFRDRDVFEGIRLFAQGLLDVYNAITVCGESPISQDLLDFIRDILSCQSVGDCVHLVIDIGEITLILYENEHEIYGDILAADNCFQLEAYEQGGLSIGRVTYACLTLR